MRKGAMRMDQRQKRLIAVVLCIIGIVGTLMAMKDSSAVRTREPAGQMETAVPEQSSGKT